MALSKNMQASLHTKWHAKYRRYLIAITSIDATHF